MLFFSSFSFFSHYVRCRFTMSLSSLLLDLSNLSACPKSYPSLAAPCEVSNILFTCYRDFVPYLNTGSSDRGCFVTVQTVNPTPILLEAN